jgi:hypothetical protein
MVNHERLAVTTMVLAPRPIATEPEVYNRQYYNREYGA